MDEAASKLRLEMDSVPEALDEIERRIMQLEIEREAIKREGDERKLLELNQEIATLSDERNSYRAKWNAEKQIVNNIQEELNNIEQLKFEAAAAGQAAVGNVVNAGQTVINNGNTAIVSAKSKAHDMEDMMARGYSII